MLHVEFQAPDAGQIDISSAVPTQIESTFDLEHLRSIMHLMQAMFSRPVPQIAAQLNAWVTALTCQWLMGPTKINDVELPDGQVFHKQGVLVKR